MSDRERLAAAIEERDAWIRLFHRLEAAVTHHKRDTLPFASNADDGLYAARDRILRDACDVPK